MSKRRDLRKAVFEAGGVKPVEVNGQYTVRTAFYKNIIYNIIAGCFKVSTAIDTDIDYVKQCLICDGKVGAFDSDYGRLLYLPSLNGLSIYHRPNGAKYVLTSAAAEYQRIIRENTEIVYLFDLLKGGFVPLINVYAEKLASIDGAIDVNIFNAKTPLILEVENAQQKATAEKMYDDVSRGKPIVFVRKTAELSGSGINNASLDLHANFIADKLQDAKRSIMNELLTILGINNANTDKRERLNADEVHSNDAELIANINLMRENLKAGCERVNRMFKGFNLDIRYDPPKAGSGVVQNADTE